MLIRDITSALERYAPLGLQEGYDNCGIQVGDPGRECTGALLTVDVTPERVLEAAGLGLNLIVSHHPLLFKGLKRITGRSPVEEAVMLAIKHDITVYSLHTALDNAPGGISHEMAAKLGLTKAATLAPQQGKLLKLTTFAPNADAPRLSDALFNAGAGAMGHYDRCSFELKGEGTFRPLEGAKPYVGSQGHMHYEPETRIEMILPSWRRAAVEAALLDAHPYEYPAYDFIATDNSAREYGSGAVGNLPMPMSPLELVAAVKEAFGSPVCRCSAPPRGQIARVALCGGSGSFLINDAIAAGAQAFITSDNSYHNFVDYADRIFIIDIGHYESEQCCKEIFYRVITEKFPNFAVHYSKTESNPIKYL